MDFEKQYSKLYDHWQRELNTKELTSLSEELLKDYKNLIREINNFNFDQKDEIKTQLLNSYQENLNYLFKDFLRIREIKLINYALSLQEIDLEVILEAEKLFYQNLVSAVKGFQKLKAFTLYENLEELHKSNVKGEEQNLLEKVDASESKIEQIEEIIKAPTSFINDIGQEEKPDYNYTLIRIIKKAPPLVGIDLINYGPFEENDIVNLPYKNAKILIYEKFAEKIEFS